MKREKCTREETMLAFELYCTIPKGKTYNVMSQILCAWLEQAKKLETGEITKEQYDQWRYKYPEFDTTQRWVKVPSQELSDYLVDAFRDKLKPD